MGNFPFVRIVDPSINSDYGCPLGFSLISNPSPDVGIWIIIDNPPISKVRYHDFVGSTSCATLAVPPVGCEDNLVLLPNGHYPIFPWRKHIEALCCEVEDDSSVEFLDVLVIDAVFWRLVGV